MSEIQDFTGLVMVPGQFGLSVPLELLMRSWGMEAHWHLPKLFEVTDFFKWYEDSIGNIEVGPRNTLEAQLVIGARMGGARMEIEYIKRLLLEIRESGGSPIEDREVSFAVELIRWSAKVSYYTPFFRDLAETLRQLREQRGIENPRLMLPEAFLLREWAINQDRQGTVDAGVDEAFGRAEPILQKALSLVENDGKNRRLSTFLVVELAADLAAQARHKRNAPNEALELFQRARDAVHRARLLDYSNFHAIDILAWASRDVLKLEALGEARCTSKICGCVFSLFPESFKSPTSNRTTPWENSTSPSTSWGQSLIPWPITKAMGRGDIDSVRIRQRFYEQWATQLSLLNPGYEFSVEGRKLIERTLLSALTPVLPITGKDIMENFGLPPGPEIGELLEVARRIYEQKPCTREILLGELRASRRTPDPP